MNNSTVLDDGAVDGLADDGGRDWFFVSGGDRIEGRLASEFVDTEGT